MTRQPVSVIMVSYHTGPVLWLAINAVCRQEGLKELVIVNNGNPKEVQERLVIMSREDSRIKLVSGHGNIGFAAGCNLGVKESDGDFLLLLNPDCILPPDAFKQSIIALTERSDAMLVGGRLVHPDGREQRGGRRNIITPKNAMAESLSLFRLLPDMERVNLHHTPMPEEIHEVPAISGACMFMRREDFLQLGGMDEGYFMHMEDMDLCKRVADAGGKIICLPQLEVVHFRSTSKASVARIEWYKTRSAIKYFYKHFRKKLFPGTLELTSLALLLRYLVKLIISFALLFLPEKDITRSQRKLIFASLYLLEEAEESPLQGKVVAVTGATSQIGLAVIGRLLSEGAQVVALEHNEVLPLAHPRLHWVNGDLADEGLDIAEHKPQILIHAAPLWLLSKALPIFTRAGVRRIVAFGSTSVFGKVYSENIYEKNIVSKLEQAEIDAQQYCRRAARNLTILRPTMVYGAGLDANITKIADIIERFGVFPVNPPADGRRQPVHVDDLALAALSIVSNVNTYNQAYNLSGGEAMSYREMVERIFVCLGKKPHIIGVPFLPLLFDALSLLKGKGSINGEMARRMNQDLVFLSSEARRDFHYHPRGFLTGGLRDLGKA